MRDGYVRQAIVLALLVLAFFLVITALLFATARGEEPEGEADPTTLVSLPAAPLSGGYHPDGCRLQGWEWTLAEFSGWHRGHNYSHRRRSSRRHSRARRDRDNGLVARYNRVEGLYLGVRFGRERWWRRPYYNFALWGEGGYGFSSKAWRYQVGLERFFEIAGDRRYPVYRFVLGAEAHDLTETQDEWIMPSWENALAAFFVKEDFHDFYRRVGFSGYLEQELAQSILIHAEYRNDRYENMPDDPAVRKATNWSLFGGKKDFRPNPLIDEGYLRGAVGRITLDTRDDTRAPDQGWYIQAQAEFYGRQVESDYEFDRFILDIRRYQPLGFGENLDLRLRAGSSRGPLPRQFLFDLGGISTLRGYRFKEFTGSRMLLANVEYRLRADSDVMPDIWSDLLGGLNLVIFFDAGLAWFPKDDSRFDRGFEDIQWRDLKTNVGLAFTDRRGRVRLNFARRTDSGSAPIVVTFRLNRAF